MELRLTDKDTLKNLSSCRYLPKGGDIKDVLPNELYIRVLKYLIQVRSLLPKWLYGGEGETNGFRKIETDRLFNSLIGNWNRQRPIWLLLLISSLSRESIRERSVPLLDIFMDRAAVGMGKSVEAMEVYREQCRPFNRLNHDKV